MPATSASVPFHDDSSTMLTLGLHVGSRDAAAVLVRNGVVVAAAQESRFQSATATAAVAAGTSDAVSLPHEALAFCLQDAGVDIGDITHIACAVSSNVHGDLADTAALRDRLLALVPDTPAQWHFVPLAMCHQASAFLATPLPRCAVMTLDSLGELVSTCYGRHRDSRYEALGDVRLPHSLGELYRQVCAHIGFGRPGDECRVMALASLGTPRHVTLMREHVRLYDDGRYDIRPIDLTQAFGPARAPDAPMKPAHFDLAASLQEVLEDAVLQLAAWLRETTDEEDLALAGSLALNSVMATRLRDAEIFRHVWVQPAAGDAGAALGAALWVDARERRGLPEDISPSEPQALTERHEGVFTLAPRRWQMDHAYWGPAFDDADIEAELLRQALSYRRIDDSAELTGITARLLAEGRIVGWFQGRMPFGPRGLGARSLLASPMDAAMQERLNALKGREETRHIAPVVNEEQLADWFEPSAANEGRSPFMLFHYRVRQGRAARIPSALHTDRTARVQTVDRSVDPLLHDLLQAFGRCTGTPVLLNTSLRCPGAGVVATPQAALHAFQACGLDALVMGSFLLEKQSG